MTATIPFDRVFSVSAEQLKVSYLVSLRQLLGPPSTLPSAAEIPAAVAAVAEPEAEAEESAAESDHDKMADIDADAENGKSTKPSKKRKAKKRRELEYDLDDPFIDDSAMTEVYRSVFDLMGDAGAMEAAMAAADADEGFGVDAAIGAGDEDGGRTGQALFGHTSKQQPSFFVYRGPLSNEILAKEFDIVESEAEDAETDSDGSEEDSDGASQPGSSSERKKSARAERTGKKSSSAKTKAAKAKAKAAKAKAKVQKATKPKPPKPPKQPKPPKPPKEPKQPKPADLLQDSARRFGDDLFSTDDGTVGEPGEATAAVKLTPDELGDASLMELRECLHRFKTAASATSFSPGKFPSALRPLLDESVCAVLRAFKPTCAEPLPVGLCPALASFLPFSVPALTKLLRKKILRALKESIEGEHLTRMYESWPQLVIKRLAEENSIAGGQTHTAPQDGEGTGTTIEDSPAKKPRLKFTDEMRLLIFNIVRAETDANNLAAACNCLALSEAAEDEESNPEQPQQLQQFKVQTEMNLRRTIYAKLAAVSALPAGLVSTTDLSREFGAHKRKHEKRLAKVAAEIIFGEESIEALLKPPKVETATAAGGATDQQPLPSEPSTPAPTLNPLMNLFDEPDDAAEQPPLPAPSPMEM